MCIVAKHVYGTALEGSDGRVGTVCDLLFDNQSWKLRHLVVSSGHWLRGRQVLLDPEVIEHADWPERHVQVRLTREQARQSPNADADLPVAPADVGSRHAGAGLGSLLGEDPRFVVVV